MPDTGWVSASSWSTLDLPSCDGTWSQPYVIYDSDDMLDSFPSGSGKNGQGLSTALFLRGYGLQTLIPDSAEFLGLEVRWAFGVPNSTSFSPFIWLEIPGVSETVNTDTHTAKSIADDGKASPFDTQELARREVVDRSGGGQLWQYTIGGPTITTEWHPGLTMSGLRNNDFGLVIVAGCGQYNDMGLNRLDVKVHYAGGDPMSVRDGGTWKTANPYVKDGGIWKPATPHVKDGGIWKAS